MTVAILKTSPETVVEDYQKLFQLAGYKPKDNAILKLNLSWTYYFPACSTQPWQLEGVCKALKGKKATAVEHRTVVTDVKKGPYLNKWYPILEKYKIPFQPLTEVEWVHYQPKAELKALPNVMHHIRIPKMFKGTHMIHLPTMKTHGHTQLTGAMKNAFGGLIGHHRHHCHKAIHDVLVDLLHIQQEIHKSLFAVMDGGVYGDGAGPRTMHPKVGNLILASSDQVAIDAISAKLMGFDPMKIPFLKRAHDEGLGIADTDQIELVGDDVSKINFHCQSRKSPVIFFDQLFRKKMKSLEPLLFHTGLFQACIFGSEFYHDYLWYPTVGKHRINQFKKTGWGKLWQQYQR